MVKIASPLEAGVATKVNEASDEGHEEDFKPLTAAQAQIWRQSNPASSPWRVLGLQCVVVALLAISTGWVSGQFRLAASVFWGGLAVVIPAVVFVRALGRQMRKAQPGSALLGLMVWELVKVLLTVALLLVAPIVISDLSWFALVAGFVATMKVYWLAMALGWWQKNRR